MPVPSSPPSNTSSNLSSSQHTNPQGTMLMDLNNTVEQMGSTQSFAGSIQSSSMVINTTNKNYS
jgi:hypothetical protein